MKLSRNRRLGPVIVACSGIWTLASCSGSDASTPSGTGGAGAGAAAAPGAGAFAGAGGGAAFPGAGGAAATAGAAATTGAGGSAVSTPETPGLTVEGCPGGMTQDPSVVGALPDCTTCTNAKCVPNSLVPEGSADVLGACDENNKCVPVGYAVLNGEFKPKPCRSLLDAEGRCISTCVPQVAAQADQLPQADCGPDELCAPCFDPIDHSDTGACSQGCDTGPSEPGVFFEDCGMGRGKCVPAELVPPELAMSVPQDTCPTGFGCAPTEKARDQSYKFPPCQAALAGLLPAPGACVPAYIVPPDQAGLITQGPCAPGELCAPCENPLMGNMSTGACE